ncbi:MAG: T9SS type A sorting domain-containing protein [candidate division WOR-3 bacterium]|nr:MAG: T9SS type A sorting domain-containing protein [candidate division WOR-3 bacterium]
MKVFFIMVASFIATGFAAETVAFTDNWGQYPMFNVVSEHPGGMEIVFSVHEMVIEDIDVDGVVMKNYGIPGIFLFNKEGAPNLPSTGRYIAIPQGAQAQLTILASRSEVYQDVEILPAPKIPMGDDDSPLSYVKNPAIYSRNAYYPEAPAILSEPEKIRGVDVVTLGISPFQYNPVTKELIVYKDLRVRIDFIGGNGHFGDDRLRSRFWEPILQNHVINYNSLPQIDFYSTERVFSRDGWEYIIIVPDDAVFEAWADTIKNWRKLQGISCEVFTLTEIGGTSATAIESFINTAYSTWNPAPVAFLILSDYPVSGDRTYGVTSPRWNNYCASDNIYADFNSDNRPDMHHARICAQSEAELSIMINKFLNYERTPYTAFNFYNEPLMAGAWQTTRWFQLCLEIVRGFLVNELGKTPTREYQVYDGTPVVGGPWSTAANTSTIVNYFYNLGWLPSTTNPYDVTWWSGGTSTGINNAINSGAFLVQHRDHGYGDGTGWAEPHYTLVELEGLSNTMFPFVYSTNCNTGQYDLPYECFTEKFHRRGVGALGVNSPTETSHSFVNDTYVWGMYDALWPQFMPGYPLMGPQLPIGHSTLMPCLAMTSGKYFLYQSNWPYSGDKIMTLHLFHHHGDVFNPLYSEVPTALTVSHAPRVLANATSFQVTANDSSIIALTVDGEIIGVAEGTGAPVNVTIIPQSVGSVVKITITKYNHYRYETDVPVVPTNYGFPIIATTVLSGTGTNGMINPGETIDYGVYAKNLGTQTLNSVYGLLTSSDPYASILVDSAWYSTIAELDSARSSPDYSFTVANNCPNGHALEFTLEFHDINDSTWMYGPTFTVYAPLLTYQSLEVLGGTWNNGLLDPTETADLVVTLMNEGGQDADNVNATLTTTSSGISIIDNNGNFGSIPIGNTATNTGNPFTLYASAGIPFGTQVDLALIVQSNIYIDTIDFTMKIGQPPPTDTGYYHAYYSGGPYAQSPVFDWMAIDSTQTANPGISLDLGFNQTVVVDLPFTFRYYGVDYDRISICSNGWISMDSTDSNDGSNTGIPNIDGPPGMVAGLWDFLHPAVTGQPADIYYFYDSANNRFIVEFFRVGHFPSGLNQETFEIILYDPAYYPTPTADGEVVVQYLTELQALGVSTLGIENYSQTVGVEYCYNATYDSLAVPVTDSFAIRYTTIAPSPGVSEYSEPDILPAQTRLATIHPNPFTRQLRIDYVLAAGDGSARLSIYDAAGRLVRDLTSVVVRTGYQSSVIWDARDGHGRQVPSGIYFVRLDTDQYQSIQKTVLLK